MMKTIANSFVFCALLFVVTLRSEAEIKVASPFTDHMVLQRDLPVPVWGTANPGTTIHITFAEQNITVKTDSVGTWRATLEPLSASSASRTLKVSGDSTNEASVELKDVLVGEVWLASGQSNMDFTVGRTAKRYFAGVRDEKAEIAAANHPLVRMFTGEWKLSQKPVNTLEGEWKVCSPDTVADFSAVAYFFGRDLQQALNVPVGLVTMAYGASTAQAWIQREVIAADEQLKPILDEFDEKVKKFVPLSAEEAEAWQKTLAAAKAAGTHPPRRPNTDPLQDQHNPTVLFNGMIAPLIPYTLRGVVWYQGESITEPKALFSHWNKTLITNWRQLWGRELPFYFCQLAAHKANSNGANVREMQTEALQLPATGMAVTIDIGDTGDVHPRNKQDVGTRLCRIALAKTYHREVEFSGPVFDSVHGEASILKLSFSHLGGGLIARGGPLKTFEIAGADGKYCPAQASIENDCVVVQSLDVPEPVSARYAWSSDPVGCNLYNLEGLPAAPFRTDHAATK